MCNPPPVRPRKAVALLLSWLIYFQYGQPAMTRIGVEVGPHERDCEQAYNLTTFGRRQRFTSPHVHSAS